MNSQEIRRGFLKYFKSQGHTVVPSSPVIPADDPTLLFNNAGMNQFKDVFLGQDKRSYTRATSSQKCIRAGGKHNDLENVGHTTRHLTFFEMLGNFSFGDYFKKEAIAYAWDLTTHVWGLNPDKIWASVYKEDDESFTLWEKHLPTNRIVRLGEKDNFWAMGDVGPCGPCSELLYDRGSSYSKAKSPIEDLEGERFLEFWNLVFMQYNRNEDGVLSQLPNKNIDTGAGLERIALLSMGVDNVFLTDILRGLIAEVENISKKKYSEKDKILAPAFQVIADHIRSLGFAIADGAQPSNIDRGYVLRKILRRAVRYGRMLGLEKPFLSKLMPRLIGLMGEDYPELISSKHRIEEILTIEEETFIKTLERGGTLLNKIIENTKDKISGDDAFKLKDTYGFPLEEILLIAKDNHLKVDLKKYEKLEEEAKERSKKAHKTTFQECSENFFKDFSKTHKPTHFVGYDKCSTSSKILAIVVNNNFSDEIQEGQEGMIILDTTPFYAEMGGQIGDTGTITKDGFVFEVTGCCCPYNGIISHMGIMKKGKLKKQDKITAEIDKERRTNICSHHTATHLLHWALSKVLGEHIKQAGSVVEEKRLRFDFSHHKSLTREELNKVEDLVNEKIRQDTPIKTYEIPFEEAQKDSKIKQLFGEKYSEMVRVIDIDFSKELCGGTHASHLGAIGLFKITKESSIAAGIRRIEAVTGKYAEQYVREKENLIYSLSSLVKTTPAKLEDGIKHLMEENKSKQKTIKDLKKLQTSYLLDSIINNSEKINSCSLISKEVDLDFSEIMILANDIYTKTKNAVIVLGTKSKDKCQILIKVSPSIVEKGIYADELIKEISPIIAGGGGGKKDTAQAGGKNPNNLQKAFDIIKKSIKEKC